MNLLESLQCLLEGKKGDWIIANFNSLIQPLYNKFQEDHSFDMSVAESKAKDILAKKEKGEISEEDAKKEVLRLILDDVEQKFPFIRKNLAWVLKQYADNQFLFEDFPRVETKLEKFEKAKNRKKVEVVDINKYNYVSLVDTLDNIDDEDLKSDHLKRKERREEVEKALNAEEPEEMKSKDFEIVVKTPELIVFHPFNYDGEVACVPAIHKGKACEWCTRASREATRWGTNGEGYFNNYAKDGPIFPMHDLVHDEWYQAHFESNQFKDWKDREIDNLDKFLEERPYIKQFFIDYITKHPMLVKKSRRWTKYLDKSKLDPELSDWLSYEGSNIDFLTTMYEKGLAIPEKTKEQIIEMEPNLITRIKSPSIELQKLALSRNDSAFRFSCPEEIRRLAISKNPSNIVKFDEGKVRVNGEVKTLTANDILTDEDIKLALSKKPSLITIIVNNDNFSKFKTIDNIKFALEKDASSEYPDRIDYQIFSHIPEELRTWVEEIYNKGNK